MSNSPKVTFSIENNNVLQSTPTSGVSFVFARTTKGPKNDPSEIINSPTHFTRVFGEEIIPGQTVSQIEKALQGGSKLRICRVMGAGAAQGTVPGTIGFTIDGKSVAIGFKTQGYGDPVDGRDTFKVKVITQNYATYLQVISAVNEAILENIYLYSYKEDANGNPMMDATGLTKFNSLSQYLKLYIASDKSTQNINTPSKLKAWLEEATTAITIAVTSGVARAALDDEEGIAGLAATENQETTWESSTGSVGAEPTLDDWKAAIDTLKDYVDVYNVAFSGINHHLSPTEVIQLHKEMTTLVNELQEYRYFVELPWWPADNSNYKAPTDPTDYLKMIAMSKTWIGIMGNSKWVGLFGGGLQYYDSEGELQNADLIGSVLGLADTVATSRGYWQSFAGLQKGVLYDAIGPVIPNYGSPSRYDQLNELAQNYINLPVIKDTPSSGKQTVLWHGFSTQFKQDSFRFLSISGLILYIKKTLRPIYDKYIEEPNIWDTWKLIFAEVKPILDSLVDANAIESYNYLGDQNAQRWSDLQVNNEADVRQGKYKVKLSVKDIVPMQDINIAISIDAASRSISITQED